MKKNNCQIVMYHYVRDKKTNKYQNLKFLSTEEFESQIIYLKKKYNLLDPSKVYENYNENKNLNSEDCFLTFDDGYADHYSFVLPILLKYNVKAFFFPPIISTIAEDVLDVNRIHHILACKNDPPLLYKEIKQMFYEMELENKYGDFDKYCQNLDHRSGNRYDENLSAIIKRLLQRDLDLEDRNEISNFLFNKYVSSDLRSFARELYMDINQLREIKSYGHEIGSHGFFHNWYSKLSEAEQSEDIQKSIKFLREHDLVGEKWSICYPYGDFNKTTIKILKNMNCSLGFTRVIPNNDGGYRTKLTIPRWDTNDYPKK
ncbi:polysaccharide deacetylase family protein [Pelagibacteraceae bacterium]|nr:polysaccharide deacetylase family protein [Pelagibacteraceae bacterium]